MSAAWSSSIDGSTQPVVRLSRSDKQAYVAVGNLAFGLDNGVVVERVVVDGEPAVLHGEHRVLVADQPTAPLVVGRARDPSGEIKRLAPTTPMVGTRYGSSAVGTRSAGRDDAASGRSGGWRRVRASGRRATHTVALSLGQSSTSSVNRSGSLSARSVHSEDRR